MKFSLEDYANNVRSQVFPQAPRGETFRGDPGFPEDATVRVRNLEAPEWRPETPLTPLVATYWRVYALDAGLNEGPMSEARSFTPVFPVGDVQVGVEGVPPGRP